LTFLAQYWSEMSKRKARADQIGSRSSVEDLVRSLLGNRETVSSGLVATAAGITRQAAHYHLARMVREGELVRSGSGRGARYAPLTDFARTYALAGLDEHRVWLEVLDEVPALRDASRNVRSILDYAFTEMLNNAVDHSRGTEATVRVWMGAREAAFEILDDGVGVFRTIRERFGLPDEFAALQELAKGKATTNPDRHSGEGIFFTSRAVDLFWIESGDLRWSVDNRRQDEAVGTSTGRVGTRVRCEVSRTTERTLPKVFAMFAATPDSFAFTKTSLRVHLYEIGGAGFVSRSEAKRLGSRLEAFEEVELDFTGVDEVGQGFVDELFRVWARAHPQVRLVPVNMVPPVERMVARGRSG
jgi:anti-sigma regulatory factor (Ser/Thr protein kinase)